MLGRGPKEQILNIRQIIEKARKFNVKAYLCFVDYKKAFDKIKWETRGTGHTNSSTTYQKPVCNKLNKSVNKILSTEFETKAGVR